MKSDTQASRAGGGYRYLFGPVPSRRLGLSLGVDLIPAKTCSFDCVFCQLGNTTTGTVERREYVPVGDVLAEFEHWLASGGAADTVTLAGSGEPTLHARFGDVLRELKERCATRRTLLTNGSLFPDRAVRRDACEADVVKASLSAWNPQMFEDLNRPRGLVSLQAVLEGLRHFRQEFTGTFWIEVFFVEGINSDDESVRRIAELVRGIGPDRVHLNTVVRPAVDPTVRAVDGARLQAFAEVFGPTAEVIADFQRAPGSALFERGGELLAVLRRHPATADELAASFGLSAATVKKRLASLLAQGDVRKERRNAKTYYVEDHHAEGRRSEGADPEAKV